MSCRAPRMGPDPEAPRNGYCVHQVSVCAEIRLGRFSGLSVPGVVFFSLAGGGFRSLVEPGPFLVGGEGHDRAQKALLLPRLTHYVSERVVELGNKKDIWNLTLLVPPVWQLSSVGGQRSFERLRSGACVCALN